MMSHPGNFKEVEACVKLLCDQAKKHLKAREFEKALSGYYKVFKFVINFFFFFFF